MKTTRKNCGSFATHLTTCSAIESLLEQCVNDGHGISIALKVRNGLDIFVEHNLQQWTYKGKWNVNRIYKECFNCQLSLFFFALSAVNQVEKKKNAATLIFYFTCNSLKSSSNWRSWRQSFRWEACLFQNSSSVLCVSSIWINSLGITKNCTNYNSFLLSGLKTELKGDNDNQTTKKYLSTVVMLTSWPAQGSHRRPGVERGAGFLIKFRRVSPCALALFNSVLRLAYSCPWCCRTAWVLCTSLGSSVSWRRRENLRSAAPMSAVFAEKLSTD